MNNAICGSPKGVFTPYALKAYPDATAGIHTQYQVSEMLDLNVGLFDGSWTEQYLTGWDWSMGRNGVAAAGEIQIYFDRAPKGGAQQVIKIGANHNTGGFSEFHTENITSGTTSIYLLTDWKLFSEDGDINQGLALFGSIVANSDDEIAALPLSLTAGFVWEGLIPSRNRDKLGFVFTLAEHSKYNTYTHDYIAGKERGNETLMELAYNVIIGHGLEIMPTIQYIINPNGSKDFDNVTILGARFIIIF